MIPIDKNPTVNTNLKDYNIIISRIAPRNQGVDVEVRCTSKYKPYYKISRIVAMSFCEPRS